MTSETVKALGKLWKEGKTSGDFEQYYLEFKDSIDAELDIKPIEVKKRGRPKN